MKTLMILAGGKSSRMGKDKAFLPYEGQTFLESLYRKAEAFFTEIIISAAGAAQEEKIRKILPEAKVVLDHYPECGPVGGIVSVYEETGIERCSVIPVDVPKANMQVLSYFYDQCQDGACVFLNQEGRVEPLIAAYGKDRLAGLSDLLHAGIYRPVRVLKEEDLRLSEEVLKERIPDLSGCALSEAFSNINTEQDYKDQII